MLQVHRCQTEEDCWELCGRFLSEYLAVIELHGLGCKRASRRRLVEEHWAQLVGQLYLLTGRLKELGHDGPAWRMREILEMTAAKDLTNPAMRSAVKAQYESFVQKLVVAA